MSLLQSFLSGADRFFGGSGYLGKDDENDVYADPADVRPPARVESGEPANPFDDGEPATPPASSAPAPAASAESAAEPEPEPAPQPEPRSQPPAEEEDLYAETAGASGDTQSEDVPQAFGGYALRWLRAYRTSEGNNTFLDQQDVESYYAVEHPEMDEDEIMRLIADDMNAGKLILSAFALNYDGTPKALLPPNHPVSGLLFAEIAGDTDPAPQPEQPGEPATPPAPAASAESAAEPEPAPEPQPPAEGKSDPPQDPPAPAESAPASTIGIDLEKITAGMSPESKAFFLRAYAEKMAEAAIRATQPPVSAPLPEEKEAPAPPPPPAGRGMPPVVRPKYDT